LNRTKDADLCVHFTSFDLHPMAIEQQAELKLKIFTLILAVLLWFSRSCEKCAYVPWVFIFELLSVTTNFICTTLFCSAVGHN